MAVTILSDLAFVPQVFTQYVMNAVRKNSALFSSAAVQNAPVLIPTSGSKVAMPAFVGLNGAANVLGDGCQTPNALPSLVQLAAILERGKVWAVNGLVESFIGKNPFDALGDQVAKFWQREIDNTAIAESIGSAKGIQADGGTVVYDISALTGNNAKISGAAIIAARALAGEGAEDFNILVVNSAVFAALMTQNLVTTLPNSEGIYINTYMGMKVVVNDGLTATGGNYNTLLVREGAFGYAENTDPRKALEEYRDVLCNVDGLSIQKRFVIHPYGATFDGTPTGRTATNTELATAANWSIAGDQLDYGIRLLISKI